MDENLNLVSPLHSLMITLSFVSSSIRNVSMDRSYRLLVKAKDEAKCIVRERTGIVMDAADPTGKGGSTNKGDVCQRLLIQ